jgi:DNA-binding transcriptional regulator GbsR (MarR family)
MNVGHYERGFRSGETETRTRDTTIFRRGGQPFELPPYALHFSESARSDDSAENAANGARWLWIPAPSRASVPKRAAARCRDATRPSARPSAPYAMRCLRSHKFVLSHASVYAGPVPTDAELTFADHMGRFYARRFAFPPMVGRLIGYLAVCDPPEQSVGELAEALLASRSAIANAVKSLETLRLVRRTRVAGERMDRVRLDLTSSQAMGLDTSEYEEMGELVREGLEVVRDAPAERRAVLLEWSEFADFVLEHTKRMQQEWRERRAALVAEGRLPEQPGHGGRA